MFPPNKHVITYIPTEPTPRRQLNHISFTIFDTSTFGDVCILESPSLEELTHRKLKHFSEHVVL